MVFSFPSPHKLAAPCSSGAWHDPQGHPRDHRVIQGGNPPPPSGVLGTRGVG